MSRPIHVFILCPTDHSFQGNLVKTLLSDRETPDHIFCVMALPFCDGPPSMTARVETLAGLTFLELTGKHSSLQLLNEAWRYTQRNPNGLEPPRTVIPITENTVPSRSMIHSLVTADIRRAVTWPMVRFTGDSTVRVFEDISTTRTPILHMMTISGTAIEYDLFIQCMQRLVPRLMVDYGQFVELINSMAEDDNRNDPPSIEVGIVMPL